MRDAEHIEKAFDFGGMPARNGVAAAAMVAQGFTGVEDVFSGERNFFVAYDEPQRIGKPPAAERLIRARRDFEIMNTNIKRWSVGSPIQAPLDALLDLIREHSIKADDVEEARRARRAAGREHRRQPRHARHLHAAHVRGDAARRHRHFRIGARREAHAGPQGAWRCAAASSSTATRR